ncbi:RNase H domain-containing protein [Trichonephila clavata]|uniref:RNase H domain-containing protein n=1 Tax=Trichonephila clavata TaxID=2740835 RepID=A0A8X6KQX1_TRICU|nr:RNase H domain-containing protein [Trichonephila clavata]
MQLPNILLTLRQMSLSKLALQVFHDPDVRLFTSTHDIHCCIWPREEIESFLGKEPVTLLNDEQVYQFLFVLARPTLETEYKHRYTGDGKYHSLPNKQWEILLNQKLSTLSLPNMFKKDVKGLIRLIVIESYIWFQDHKTTIQSTTNLQNHFHWTQDNKIDRQKTAKSIIADDNIILLDRFMIALLYCFEVDAYFFWKKLSYRFRHDFEGDLFYEKSKTWFLHFSYGDEIDWEEYARKISRNDFGFRTYLPKMRQEKRLECVMLLLNQNWINYHELQFCLSTLDQNQQIKVMKKCSFEILKMFLDWPLREKLLDVLKILWPYLSEMNFRDLLDLILCQKRLFNWISYDTYTLAEELRKRNPFIYNKSINYYTLKSALKCKGSLSFKNELRGRSNDDIFIAFYSGNTVFAICKNYFSNVTVNHLRFFSMHSRHYNKCFS